MGLDYITYVSLSLSILLLGGFGGDFLGDVIFFLGESAPFFGDGLYGLFLISDISSISGSYSSS